MTVTRFHPIIIYNSQIHNSTLTRTSRYQENTNIDGKSSESEFNMTSNDGNEVIYKFYVPDDIDVATAHILFKQACAECSDIGFYVKANAYPYTESRRDIPSYVHKTIVKLDQTNKTIITFFVQPSSWNYVVLKFVNQVGKSSTTMTNHQKESYQNILNKRLILNENISERLRNLSYSLSIHFQKSSDGTHSSVTAGHKEASASTRHPTRFRDIDFYTLVRQSYREFFTFDYDLEQDEDGSVPKLLNIIVSRPVGFAFDVGDVNDIGGTLTFALSIKQSDTSPVKVKSILGSIRQDMIRKEQTIIVCMHLNSPGIPTWPNKCRYDQWLMPASSIIKNTNSENSTGIVHVPFPESGRWYVTISLFCHSSGSPKLRNIGSIKKLLSQYIHMLRDMQSPCPCAESKSRIENCIADPFCLSIVNDTDTLKIMECMMDKRCTSNYDQEMVLSFHMQYKLATQQHFEMDNCNTSVFFSISSSSCVAGGCGRFGRCYHYMSGGFVFSTCICANGYRGWDCSEDSQVPPSALIWLQLLLLTLSNLLFIPSIYIAVRRSYYTEAIIYFFSMVFSILYHACDSGGDEHSFCLVKNGTLQFCDFYCGILAIWVTLIAMAHVRPQLVSLLHMVGAILLAFGTQLNKQSLWIFLVPTISGICIISVSWGIACLKTRMLFPELLYLTICIPIGAVLVIVGLVCYALLQTKQNYYIIHSIWHIVMAISIICLLPPHKYFIIKC
ncbi:uncharacterized protein LOC115629975 isoform X2 [Scaptodrosophila lebanonensis]|nr:uncharacterized protein LOC115629975 isoform X2 [Scaptodrosophila lebanonensis]